ncbi:PfkB family carbohydrate kinase [Deinococcus maricopensis]|uniref:PfkB domain protein n=1 Tax=Deinococcus maricopensis (strain DSM 21211 / LMG 22137 / NRRL B-23946 / LB-34) TaxID=709986 RepID=E8UBQ3_DEIML|nr:PfkB family carbohydrate kinase [Deinococcus maricopensis]ADV68492.1 PfkB domain protein [Deinococcus maricopensis DSM 21211]
MSLTDRERELLRLLREHPLATPEDLARLTGNTRAAVNVHLTRLREKGHILGRGYVLRPEGSVLVIGGANLDLKSRLHAPAVPGTSNPGTTTAAPGGVARNIAENLARLGVPTGLLSAIGHDDTGARLLDATRASGVDVSPIVRTDDPTGTYSAILDPHGELILAVASMRAVDALTPDVIRTRRALIDRASAVIVDCNVPQDTLLHAARTAQASHTPLYVEPVSVPKAARLRALLAEGLPVHAVTPNRDELAALTDRDTRTDDGLHAAVQDLHARGVRVVWVRLGEAGSLLSADGDARHHAATPTQVRDVTGAGDAMLAGYLYATLRGDDPHTAARAGHALAALTIQSDHTVRPDLTADLLDAHTQETA